MPPASLIWQIGLFSKINSHEAICHEFKKTIKCVKGSTSNAINHLHSKHKNSEYTFKFEDLSKQKEGEKGALEKHMVLGSGGLSSYDKKVIHWIACTQSSFSDINNPTTHMLFMSNNPLHKLKDESVYRKNILPTVYQLVKTKVEKEMEECPKISFTSDIWSDSSNSFISLTAYGIGKNFERKSYILSVSEFEGSHTGERIAEKLRDLLRKWNFTNDKIFFFVHNEGSNFQKAFNNLDLNVEGFLNTNCAAHMENIIVRGALDKSQTVKILLAKCRHIVGHYKHSTLAANILKNIQKDLGLPIHTLLQDIPTRWNAAFNMLRRIMEQQQALAQYAIQTRKFDFSFDGKESSLMNELVVLLEPLEQLNRIFCRQTSTISVKYPFAKLTIQKLDQINFENAEVYQMRDQIVDGLKKKFFGYKNNRASNCYVSGPQIQGQIADFPDILRRLIFTHIEILPEQQRAAEQIVVPVLSDYIVAKKPKGLHAFFDETLAHNSLSQENSFGIPEGIDFMAEINAYSSTSLSLSEADPMEFWAEKRNEFPVLAREAQKFLCTPATSVASEQLFSTARDTYTYRRRRLGPRKAEMLIFLNRNLTKINFKY